MNHKERFLAACEHREADRSPIDYLAHPEADRRLCEYLEVSTEEELLDALECDFYYLPGRDISQNEGYKPFYIGRDLEETQSERVCPLGIRWQRGAYDSKFFVDEVIAGPFEGGATAKDILGHGWPKAADFDFSPLQEICETHKKRVLIGGLWTGILGDSYRMYGFQEFLTDMALRPDVIQTLVDRMTDMYLELNEGVFSLLKGKMDVWFFGNDFGHQKGLLFSTVMWEDFFLDNIRRLCKHAHGYGLRVMMHSCGAVSKLIPLLIEAGVDILDPVQVSAVNMQPDKLKESFGGKIVFHGGIDTQHILPSGSPEDCREHARQILKALGTQGGYIFAPSQIYQPDIPVENIVAVYQVAKEKTNITGGI
ncbi:MAG: hypothetical protein JXM70_26790 [Pirellulales bacterium]|nr:hypothetical protein [Pirellulales bacterium]